METYKLVLKLCHNSHECQLAYNAGYAAGYEGVLFNENVNPFPANTSENLCWDEGFAEGRSDN